MPPVNYIGRYAPNSMTGAPPAHAFHIQDYDSCFGYCLGKRALPPPGRTSRREKTANSNALEGR